MTRLPLSWLPGRKQPMLSNPTPKPEPTDEQQAQAKQLEEKLDAHVRAKAGQVTFYPYDRGQCFDKGERAVMAIVNWPGAAAHYMWSTNEATWQFVDMPHLSTEQRCAERMGYGSIAKMHADLFVKFDEWLLQNSFPAKLFTACRVRKGEVVETRKRSNPVAAVEEAAEEFQVNRRAARLASFFKDEEGEDYGWGVVDGMGQMPTAIEPLIGRTIKLEDEIATDHVLAVSEQLHKLHQQEVEQGVPAAERRWPWSIAGLQKVLGFTRAP